MEKEELERFSAELWKRFVFKMSVDAFGEKEVITEGKKIANFLGSVGKHEKIFKEALQELLTKE